MASLASAANFDGEKSRNSKPLISRNKIGERIRDALHLHVGRGRRYSVRELAEGSGVPERLIEAAKCDPDDPEHRPLSLENLFSLIKFLGAPFASAILEPAELGAFELADGQIPLPKVLSSSPVNEDVAEERKRLIRRLAELEDVA